MGRINTLLSMSTRDINALRRIMTPTGTTEERRETVAEYITRTGCRVDRWTSRRGVDMARVWFDGGSVREFPAHRLDVVTVPEF